MIGALESVTGQLSYTIPSPWVLYSNTEKIAIVPRKSYLGMSICTVFLLSAFGVGFSMWINNYFILVFMLVVATMIVVMYYITSAREKRLGPWLVGYKQRDRVELPRNNRVITKEEIIAFQQVTGKVHDSKNYLVELNVLIKTVNGGIERLQLIGSKAENAVGKISVALSKELGVELQRLKYNRKDQIIKREIIGGKHDTLH